MIRLIFLSVIVLAADPASAWRVQGHMATGAIAFDQLAASDPAAIDRIRRIMAAHPEQARFAATLGDLAGARRDRLLFELMARWPDDVRHTRFDHPHWHHELRVVSGWRLLGGIRLGNAESAFRRNWAIARDAQADPARRAMALCWLFHLVGDMHQPLHAGHRMSAAFPITDKAGTLAWVRPAAGVRPVNLHYFWDDAAERPGSDIEGAESIATAAEAAVGPAALPVDDRPAAAQFHGWAIESERLAADVAYQGAALNATPDRKAAPVLPEAYVAAARILAERRLGEAGIRLARLLEALFPVACGPQDPSC